MLDPQFNVVHTGNTVEAFSAVVLLVPGQKPEVIVTPRLVVPVTGPNHHAALLAVADEVVGRGMIDIASELRRRANGEVREAA